MRSGFHDLTDDLEDDMGLETLFKVEERTRNRSRWSYFGNFRIPNGFWVVSVSPAYSRQLFPYTNDTPGARQKICVQYNISDLSLREYFSDVVTSRKSE